MYEYVVKLSPKQLDVGPWTSCTFPSRYRAQRPFAPKQAVSRGDKDESSFKSGARPFSHWKRGTMLIAMSFTFWCSLFC